MPPRSRERIRSPHSDSVGIGGGGTKGVLVGVGVSSISPGVGTIGVDVAVGVGVLVGVLVAVAVLVGVLVGVFVAVLLGVFVGVFVGVLVGVFVGVLVGVSVGVFVGAFVGVFVGVLVGVGVGVSGMPMFDVAWPPKHGFDVAPPFGFLSAVRQSVVPSCLSPSAETLAMRFCPWRSAPLAM